MPTWEPPSAKPLSGPQHGPVQPPSAGLATVRHRGRADLFHAAAADEGTSIAAASAKCGLPAGSIYWHFEDKDYLIAAVIERSFETWLRAVEPPGEDAGTPLERATLMAANVARSLVDAPDFLRPGLILALERRPTEPRGRAVFLQVREVSRQRIAGSSASCSRVRAEGADG